MPPKNKKGKKKTQSGNTNTADPSPRDTTPKGEQGFPQPQEPETLEDYATNVLKMKESESRKNIKAFRLIDKNGSNKISKEEFRNLLDEYRFGENWTHETMNSLFDEMDQNNSGKINGQEFLDFLASDKSNKNLSVMVDYIVEKNKEDVEERKIEEPNVPKKRRENSEINKKQELYKKLGPEEYAKTQLGIETKDYQKYLKTFDLMDLNDSGKICRTEFDTLLKQFSLGVNLTKDEVREMFDDMDHDEDGEINLHDFLESLNRDNPNQTLLVLNKEILSQKEEIQNFKSTNILVKSIELKSKEESKEPENNDLKGLNIDKKKYESYKNAFYVLASEIKGTFNQNQYKAALKLHAKNAGQDLKSPEKVSESFNLMDTDKDGNVKLINFIQSIQKGDNKILNDLVEGLIKLEETINNIKDSETVEKAAEYAKNALKLPSYQIERCKKAFKLIDADESGELTLPEFTEIIKNFGLMPGVSPQDIKKMFQSLDEDKSGKIGLKEFLQGVSEIKKIDRLESLIEAINRKEKDILNYRMKQSSWKTRVKSPKKLQASPTTPKEIIKADKAEGEKIKRSILPPG